MLKLIRAGSLSGTVMQMRNVLFLCTGNYYRSRFAEILFNHLATKEQIKWRATSRGLKTSLAGPGGVSLHTALRLTELGISADAALERMPVQCRVCDLEGASMVIALKEAEHRAMIAQDFDGWQDRVTYWNVHDIDEAAPSSALPELQQLVIRLVAELKSHDGF